jgi:hypothetical protein
MPTNQTRHFDILNVNALLLTSPCGIYGGRQHCERLSAEYISLPISVSLHEYFRLEVQSK